MSSRAQSARSRWGVRLGAALVAAVAVATAPSAAGASTPAHWNRPPARLDASVAVTWFDLLYDLIRDARLSPPVASRAIGYSGVTLY